MTVQQNVEYGLMVKTRAEGGAGARVRSEALEMVRLDGFGEPQAVAALGRAAPARRARPGDRQPAAGAAARRAARRARPQAPPGDADRAQADPAGGRDHVRLRDARPGRGADDERPDRGVQPGPDRAGRAARGGLRAPASEFIAGFVGRLERDRAGRPPLTVRPEKIHVLEDGEQPEAGRTSRRGSCATSSTSGR